jgi:hypothetical protein
MPHFRRSQAYGVPSQRTPRHYYLVTLSGCTCEDAPRRPGPACKTLSPLNCMWRTRVGGELAASVVIDGLEQLVRERRHVAATAQRYDNIVREFEGD